MDLTKDKDLVLWRRWNSSHSIPDLEALMAQMRPVMMREVNRWTSIAPKLLLEAEANKQALNAFKTFNPSMGFQLSTHLTNGLMKLSRIAYSRQSSLSIPEHQRISYNQIVNIRTKLESDLGRPPTIEHLADHMQMSVPKIQKLIANVERRELMESGEGPVFQQHTDEKDAIELAYHDFTPLQKQIFDLRTGFHGGTPKKNETVIKQLAITQGQLSYQLNLIKIRLEALKRLK
jgi:DNA-directed RNA polymerase specialized sigma subunit